MILLKVGFFFIYSQLSADACASKKGGKGDKGEQNPTSGPNPSPNNNKSRFVKISQYLSILDHFFVADPLGGAKQEPYDNSGKQDSY